MMEIERIRILGVPVDNIDMNASLDFIHQRIMNRKSPGYIVAINPEKVMVIRKDPFLQSFVEGAALLIADGVGVVLAGRFLFRKKLSRVTGVDLMDKLCDLAARNQYSIFLYGAKEDVNRQASEVLMAKYPKLRIAGRCHGYIKDADMPDLIERIKADDPDILFVALGSPKQEKWIQQYLSGLSVGICQGIGGTLDAVTGHVKRAPTYMQYCGLEWLYRLVKQPTRIRRQLNLLIFLWEMIKYKCIGPKQTNG
jgi:N-acetylglucosaminyldiphosphoundecaprenol N-acetyl-beta-D-mannosaminyltransferase